MPTSQITQAAEHPRRLHSSVTHERIHILIVEDDVPFARALKRRISHLVPDADVTVAYTVADALAVVDSEVIPGMIVDMRLGDGSGIHVLQRAFTLHAEPCALALSGYRPEFAARVEALGIPLRDKPLADVDLKAFVHRAITAWSEERRAVLLATEKVATRCGLTPTQGAVLYHLARGCDIKQIAAYLKSSVRTTEGHIGAVRTKLHVHTAHGIVARIVSQISRTRQRHGIT
jgi:ActR/RegA family two-component response regulator/DNA-binding CsgD family transcriptional regulator